MSLKHTVVALAAAGLLSAQAHAGEMQVKAAIQPAQTVAAFTNADLQALFEASDKPMQLAALSQQEMRETEGAWWFTPVIAWTAGGAALGAYTAWWQNGTVTWRDIGAGATAGFYASPMGRPFGKVGRFVIGGLGHPVIHNSPDIDR